jgi:hypothetical protein
MVPRRRRTYFIFRLEGYSFVERHHSASTGTHPSVDEVIQKDEARKAAIVRLYEKQAAMTARINRSSTPDEVVKTSGGDIDRNLPAAMSDQNGRPIPPVPIRLVGPNPSRKTEPPIHSAVNTANEFVGRALGGQPRVMATAHCFTLKLPSAISMFVNDPEPLLSWGELSVSLACTAVWPNFGPSTKVTDAHWPSQEEAEN